MRGRRELAEGEFPKTRRKQRNFQKEIMSQELQQ
jgi:hypothetical protein